MARKETASEKRTEKVNLVMQPTLARQVKLLALSQNSSLSDFVCGLVERAVQRNSALIERFEKAQKQAMEEFVSDDD